MTCKLCQEKPVWKFTNQRQLCSLCFVKYFEKKVKATIRKYSMPIHFKEKSLKTKVINLITKNLPERKGKIQEQSLDDISSNILYIMMHDAAEKLKKLLPKNQPLYFLSNKEILLYAKIKKIKGKIIEKKDKRLKDINNFIKKIEQKNPDIRHNIVKALLRAKV